MRKISCPVCGYSREENDRKCPHCDSKLAQYEFLWFYKMDQVLKVHLRQLDEMYESQDIQKQFCNDNYKADIQTGVVTDPRGINE